MILACTRKNCKYTACGEKWVNGDICPRCDSGILRPENFKFSFNNSTETKPKRKKRYHEDDYR